MSFQTETGTERNEMTENQSIQCSIDSLTQSILSMLSIETKKEQFLALTVSLSNVSDMFTKALGPITFIRLRNRLMSSHNINKTDFNAEEY